MNKLESEPLLYVRIFILVIIIAAFISFVWRAVTLISSSSFKGSSYNALVIGKDIWVVHVDPTGKKMSIIQFTGGGRVFLQNKSIPVQSAALGVLVDGSVIAGPKFQYKDPGDLFLKPGFKFNNINAFDVMKMMFYSKTIPPDGKSSIKQKFSEQNLFSNDILLKLFGDEKLLTEGKSVEVINSTDIDGMANEYGTALKSIGFNVVKYDSTNGKSSSIAAQDVNSASVLRLSRALKIPIYQSPASSVADITLVLGKDILERK